MFKMVLYITGCILSCLINDMFMFPVVDLMLSSKLRAP